MNYIKPFELLCLMALSIFNCSNCSKSNQYRRNALDISGSYQTKTDSNLNMNFVIANEDNKKYDILITLNRQSPITEEEKTLLNRNGFNPQTLKSRFAQPFILGSGFESDLKNGENYSKDGGATSQFFVCSAEPDTQSDASGGLLEARYCVSGQFDRESREISGTLTLYLVYNSLRQKADGSFVAENRGEAQIKYKAQAIN